MAETYERKSNAKDSWEPLEDVHVACKAILDKLGHEILNKDCVSPFAGPTHPEVPELGDYAKIIHEPMDFGIIKERLDSGQYAVYGELPAEDAAFQWQSKSGKSQSLPRRSTGDSFEGERVCGAGFAMDKLKQTFDESRKKVLTAAGAASTLNSAFGTLWIEPDWAQFEAPANVPSKLTILFVGVDNGSAKDPDLNLKAEYMNIEQAYSESDICRCTPPRVDIRRLYFSNWKEVMMEIRKEQPTILHFGCHAQQGSGFELFQETVKPRQILDAICSWNRDARERTPARPDIRLIVLNACESDIHALDLTACVDFAIGHQRPVFDMSLSLSLAFYVNMCIYACTVAFCACILECLGLGFCTFA
jgi:hypothetical protein